MKDHMKAMGNNAEDQRKPSDSAHQTAQSLKKSPKKSQVPAVRENIKNRCLKIYHHIK